MLFRRLYGFKAYLLKIITERGGDARNMKPIGVFKYSVPIEIGGRCMCNCRILAVVNTNGRALRNALFKIVDSYPVTAPYYLVGIYPETS